MTPVCVIQNSTHSLSIGQLNEIGATLNKVLTQNQLDHLLEFVGYGRLDADIWFLVMEETGGSEENLRARLKFEQVEDLAKAHQLHGITKDQNNWRGTCEIMLRLDDKTPDDGMIQEYQSERLGQPHGATLLCALMPIPKLGSADWGYTTLFPQYETRQACYEALKPDRLDLFRQLVEEYHPKIVIGCGKEYWDDYQKAYELAINETATKKCPWYIIPADKKWYARGLISEIILQTLKEIDPSYPELSAEAKKELAVYRKSLV